MLTILWCKVFNLFLMYSTTIPSSQQSLKNQNSPTDVNDEFFQKLFEPPNFLPIHRIFQIVCFFIFLGPIKLVLSLISFFLLFFVINFLPFFKIFFSTNLGFKKWAHSIVRHFIRLFLLCLGVLRIKIDGDIDHEVRFYVSNHLSILDYLIHFYNTPLTIIKASDIYEAPNSFQSFLSSLQLERIFLGSTFDVFKLKPKKRGAAYQIAKCSSDPSFFPLLVFPEGYPTNGNAIAGFLSEYFETEYPYQPAAFQYNIFFTPRGFNSMYSGSILDFIFRILSAPFITCSITYLKKANTKNVAYKPAEIAEICQIKIANELGALAVTKVMPTKMQKQHVEWELSINSSKMLFSNYIWNFVSSLMLDFINFYFV